MSAKNLRSWIVKATGEDVAKLKKKVAVVLLREVVKRTPVDTGWARMHWRVDETGSSDLPGSAPAGSTAGQYADSAPAASNALALSGRGAIYIYNNVPYIVPLENGHSKQMGKGQMVAGAIAAARNRFGGG